MLMPPLLGLVYGTAVYFLIVLDLVVNPETNVSAYDLWSSLVIIPFILLLGIGVGIIMSAVYHASYVVRIQIQAWRLHLQGWRSAAAELRRYARNPCQWYSGLELDVPSH